MTPRRLSISIVLLAAALISCDQSAKRPVRASRPAPVVEQAALPMPREIPLNTRRYMGPNLVPPPRPAIEFLLENVAAAFASGEQNYKAGHLEKARRDFDRATDWLLTSGIDVQSDPRHQDLFDRIVDTVYAYEMAAFREGDGFTEQKAEPAAIDEIAEMTFPVDPRLKEKVERELSGILHDLPITVNDHVLSYLNFFQTPRGRAIVEGGLRRAGRYRSMISRILAEEGVPQDLIYLAQAESGFKPLALSRARALGMWQFMSYTGREYGLRRTWWVDDRQDPEKATRAAARHLRDLYEEFGDWPLVLAAYNSGAGNVSRAIQRTGYADFWQLYNRNVLPRETRNYVPIIMALTIIAKDPARYGINVQPDPPFVTDRIKPGHPIDLRLVAETIDVPFDALKELNPHLLRMVTPTDPDFEMHLPEGTAERFFAEIAAIPQENWVSWRRHRVVEGETLSGIAGKYRISTAAIASANELDPKAELQVGDKLIIPASAPAASNKSVRYRVRRGDTLETIAEQFSVTVADLKKWNRIRGSRVNRGVTLKVYPGGLLEPRKASTKPKLQTTSAKLAEVKLESAPTETGGPRVHHVRQGETLWSIARAYQTTVEALRAANSFLMSRQLRVGDQLTIMMPGR